MKLAVTGASGFIGSWVLNSLSSEYEYLALVHDPAEVGGEKPGVTWAVTDYSVSSLTSLLQGCDAVLHLAGIRPLRGADTPENYNVNITLTRALFEASLLSGVRRVVFISSIAVYSHIENTIPFSVDQPITTSMSYYGDSKRQCELLAKQYNNSALSIITLRLAQVVGHGEKAGVMVTSFVERARKRMPLPVFGKGAGVRHYVYIRDVLSAIDAALRTSLKAGTFNVGMRTPLTHLEFAKTVNRVFGNDDNIALHSEKAEDPRIFHMSIDETVLHLGWHPSWDLEAALTDMKDHPHD